MPYSSTKWKKLQKILRRLILCVSFVAIIYLTNRFSVLSMKHSIDFKDRVVAGGYILVDWHFSYGRRLQAQDIVLTKTNFSYIVATNKNILHKDNDVLCVDGIPTNFSVSNQFSIPQLAKSEYLIYIYEYGIGKMRVLDAKHIKARVLMTLFQN